MPNPIVRKRIKGVGIKPFDFNPALATFTPSMAKRTTSVFNASPIVQGKWDATAGDKIVATGGASVSGLFYPNLDLYQGSVVFWITPEWNGNDGKDHYVLYNGSPIKVRKASNSILYFYGSTASVYASIDVSAWVAGTTYCVVGRWDKKPLDGTNCVCLSINDAHTFGAALSSVTAVDMSTIYIGSVNGINDADAIIQGLTIYRRPLFDGTYGVNVGNGDEINLIYAAGVGKDPTLITGSRDVVFALPTNGTAGALVTGTGEAWSHPHSSNVLKNGWLNDGFYGGGDWAVKFNGSTTKIDCGSDAGLDNLADAEFTAEGWVLAKTSGIAYQGQVFSKGYEDANVGWRLGYSTDGVLYAGVRCATTHAAGRASMPADGKLHHVVVYFNDAGDRKPYISIDGVWNTTNQVAGIGAVVSDAAVNLWLGCSGGTSRFWDGTFGWTRISNNARYTPGTNFVPSRTPPGVDANTIAQWNMSEGTGTTVDNAEGTAARDGTITAGTWEEQWNYEGSPIIPRSVEFNATTARLDCGSDAKLDDLHDGAFTAEGWFRSNGVTYNPLFYKGTALAVGWSLCFSDTRMLADVVTSSGNISVSPTIGNPDKKYHHWAMTWDDAGDRKIRIYKDRVLISTSSAAANPVVSDATQNLFIGNRITANYSFNGGIGWVRISNVVRDIPAETYTRETCPASDANTMLLLPMNEGIGNPVDGSGSPATCTLSNGVWNYTPDMAIDCPGARVYNWGEVFGNDATHEGIYQLVTVVAGADYNIRALGYSEDGIGRPELVVYDVTNSAAIVTVLGTVASTEQVPDVFDISFEIPAGCTSIAVKLLNSIATGVVGWHQCEMHTNLWTDPGFETGTAPTNNGTPATSERSNEQAHTGTYSWKVVASTYDDGIKRAMTAVVGKFYAVSAWVYVVASGSNDAYIGLIGGQTQNGNGLNYVRVGTQGSWVKILFVVRATATTLTLIIKGYNATPTFYVDDISVRLLDDVSLTCTPASLANSTEGTGIRVDGYDALTQPIPVGKLKATKGRIRFKWTPRHSAADWAKFGVTFPLHFTWGDNNNGINLQSLGAKVIRLNGASNSVTFTYSWDATGRFLAGVTYLVEIAYTSTKMVLKIDGVIVITIAGVFNFVTIASSTNFSSPTYMVDNVISAP